MGQHYQTQGWRVNKNRWRWKATLKSSNKQCEDLFRSAEGSLFPPSPSVRFPFRSPSNARFHEAGSWLQLPDDSVRLQITGLIKWWKHFFVVVMHFSMNCYNGCLFSQAWSLNKAEACLYPLICLYPQQLFIMQPVCTEYQITLQFQNCLSVNQWDWKLRVLCKWTAIDRRWRVTFRTFALLVWPPPCASLIWVTA